MLEAKHYFWDGDSDFVAPVRQGYQAGAEFLGFPSHYGDMTYSLSEIVFGGASGVINEIKLTAQMLSAEAEATRTLRNISAINAENRSLQLADKTISETFAGGRYTSRVLKKDIILYRAGKSDTPLGQFFSKDKPVSEIQARIDKAVLPEWEDGSKSVIDTVFKVKIPAGTTIHTGKVSSQGGHYVGGTQQIVIEKPWLIEGVEVLSSNPIK